MPEKEWPAITVRPSCRASTRSAQATASGSGVKGFCTEVSLSPAACKRGITSARDDPSVNSPCTRTTLRAFGRGCAAAAVPWIRVLAAPTMLTNARRLIGYLDSLDTSAEDRLGYSSKAPLGTSRLSVPLHKDAKTSEGLLYIRLTFSLQAAYFFRAGVPSGDLRPTLGAVPCAISSRITLSTPTGANYNAGPAWSRQRHRFSICSIT